MLLKEKGFKIILASASPRRKELLESIGLEPEISPIDLEEIVEPGLSINEVAESLAVQKSQAFSKELQENEVLITADTLVSVSGQILGKPKNRKDAFKMLSDLNGSEHVVSTAVCLRRAGKQLSFVEQTQVQFHKLHEADLLYYIDTYKPFDKAGAYGIQEWIGLVGIKSIQGDYFNVVGLPVQRLYKELLSFY